MKSSAFAVTSVICATVLIGISLLVNLASAGNGGSNKGVVLIVACGVVGFGVYLFFRHLTTTKQAKIELGRGQEYRDLAEEYRRLADLAITAQEHTDLKLGEVSAQLDHMRERLESLQRILEDVE